MFKKMFGSKASGAGTKASASAVAAKTIDSLEDLNQREEQLEKRKALLEKRVEDEQKKAQEFLKLKKKPQALLCLKRKKMHEDQAMSVENLILRLTEQRMMLENQTTMADVVSTMKQASEAQKATMVHMNVNNVDEIIDSITEQTDEYKLVTEALSQPAGIAGDLNDDDLMAELEELEQQQLDSELLEPAPVPTTVAKPQSLAASMPEVPAQKAPAQKTQEELELEALEAEMAA